MSVLSLRLPESIHEKLGQLAEREGISISQLINSAVAEKLAALLTGQYWLVAGRRVAVVNDVINAGSAVRGTLADLYAAGAAPVAIGTLAVLGASASQIAAENQIALEQLVALENRIWIPSECPLCAQNLPLTAFEQA